MKILCIKDHVCSSINDFRERIRAIVYIAKKDDTVLAAQRTLEELTSHVWHMSKQENGI